MFFITKNEKDDIVIPRADKEAAAVLFDVKD